MTAFIQPAAVRRSVTVRVSRERAFSVFTEGFDRWWPRSHTISDSPLKKAVIEPRVGGRWFGLSEDGRESEWGDVLVFEPPARLVLAWRIGGQWTYDPNLLTEVEVTFTDLGQGQTRVDLEHRGLERLGAAGEAARVAIAGPEGWGGLLEAFRAAAEG
ncbi:MAG TPA: SRPBCC family protein [Bauldia sp.]|nr:SRPBCC family protein [Bauldia sp.]